MTDLQLLCSTTVAYMVREFNAHKDMTIVYQVLAEDVPYVAKQLEEASHLPHNVCAAVVIAECALMFEEHHG